MWLAYCSCGFIGAYPTGHAEELIAPKAQLETGEMLAEEGGLGCTRLVDMPFFLFSRPEGQSDHSAGGKLLTDTPEERQNCAEQLQTERD